MNNQDWPPHYVRIPQSTAHPYPFEIAMRAIIFTQGAISYYLISDVAAGEYFREAGNPHEKIRGKFFEQGITPEDWEINWNAFTAYTKAFPSPVYQNALFVMAMHWDCYIRKLGSFVEFARNHVDSPALSKNRKSDLQDISFRSITKQISILSDATGLSFGLEEATIAKLAEMNLVRNLGMHNEWAVDTYYLQFAQNKERKIGSLREITRDELLDWQQTILFTIQLTSNMIAKKYSKAPEYSPS